ncbi:MAG: hypothetical protein K2H37_06220 [Lachnospiraceae bacterium]|nr:hypothetical protein [Lachnospiraceae bacterium]
MENREEILLEEELTEDEMQGLKSWLFKENIRIMTASAELEEQREKFELEKKQFKEEMKNLNRKMNAEQKRIQQDNRLVDERLEIIKDGFQKLDMDRRRLDKEWARLAAEKEFLEERGLYDSYPETGVFFGGVKNLLMLKKRYKDLTKIYHPDNVAGDTEIIQRINREYERLKREYEEFKQA